MMKKRKLSIPSIYRQFRSRGKERKDRELNSQRVLSVGQVRLLPRDLPLKLVDPDALRTRLLKQLRGPDLGIFAIDWSITPSEKLRFRELKLQHQFPAMIFQMKNFDFVCFDFVNNNGKTAND